MLHYRGGSPEFGNTCFTKQDQTQYLFTKNQCCLFIKFSSQDL